MTDDRREAYARLRTAAAADARIGYLPDGALADLLVDVWATHPAGSTASRVLAQAVERLRRAGGGPYRQEPDA